MGNNKKKGIKGNVFKVAGAKSLKKTKTKPVNLGLKNIKQKVQEMDKEFVEINKNPISKNQKKVPVVPLQKKTENKVSAEEISKTTDKIVKMDL